MTDPKTSLPEPNIKDPKLFAAPERARFRHLYKYVSLDMVKMSQSARNYRGSLGYIGIFKLSKMVH